MGPFYKEPLRCVPEAECLSPLLNFHSGLILYVLRTVSADYLSLFTNSDHFYNDNSNIGGGLPEAVPMWREPSLE